MPSSVKPSRHTLVVKIRFRVTLLKNVEFQYSVLLHFYFLLVKKRGKILRELFLITFYLILWQFLRTMERMPSPEQIKNLKFSNISPVHIVFQGFIYSQNILILPKCQLILTNDLLKLLIPFWIL